MSTNVLVAFYKANQSNATTIDKVIAWWTKGKYSHVELIIDNHMYSTSPRDGEVRVKRHVYDKDVWDYVTVSVGSIKNISEFYRQTKGLKYDWFGIFGFIIPTKDRTNRWFCSEWVSNALKISGCKKLFTKNPSKLSPNDLYKILTKEQQ